jgi:hypothetical protein
MLQPTLKPTATLLIVAIFTPGVTPMKRAGR